MKLSSLFRPRNVSGRLVLDRLIMAVCLTTVFLVPAWFAYLIPAYNIFELNKTVVFKILVWLLFGLTAGRFIFYPVKLSVAPRVFFKKYWLMPTIFIIGLALSIFAALSPSLAFYGTPERQGGLVSYLFYFLWFILLSFNLAVSGGEAPRKVRALVVAAVSSAALVSFYALLQIMNIDFLSWPEAPYLMHRAFSSLGQPNFLASWLLLVIPLSIYLFLSARTSAGRIASFLAVIVQFCGLISTASRGGFLAALAAAGLFLAYRLFSSSWTRRRKITIAIVFILASLAVVSAFDCISGGRIRSLADYQSGSMGARANFYSAAADAIKDRPIIGYGLDNAGEVFIRYYQPDWGVFGDVAQSSDRAHNLILDILLNSGAVGLIIFSILYYSFFRLAGENIRTGKSAALSLAIIFGAAAYLISLLFSFSLVSGEVYFWLFFALLIGLSAAEGNRQPSGEGASIVRNEKSSAIGGKIIIILLLAAAVSYGVLKEIRVLQADYYFNKIYFLLGAGKFEEALALDAPWRALVINPALRGSYDSFWIEKAFEAYDSISQPETKEMVRRQFAFVDSQLAPIGYRNLLAKAKAGEVAGNLAAAEGYLSQVINLTPYWPLAYLQQGRLAVAARDYPRAIVAYHLAALNLPDAADRRLNYLHRDVILHYQYFIDWRLGEIHQIISNYAAAEKYYRLAYWANPADIALLKKIADTYYLRGDLDQAIFYNRRGQARDPQDYHWPLALAILSYEKGDSAAAAGYLDQAENLAPGNEEILNLKNKYGK